MSQHNSTSHHDQSGLDQTENPPVKPSADRYYNTRTWAGRQRDRAGRLSHGCIAWMLGLPLPIIILAFLWRGCD